MEYPHFKRRIEVIAAHRWQQIAKPISPEVSEYAAGIALGTTPCPAPADAVMDAIVTRIARHVSGPKQKRGPITKFSGGYRKTDTE